MSYFQNLDVFSWQIILLLLIAGFLTGVVNTFAGSGTAISYSVLIFLGIPITTANGTIRMGVVLQTLAAAFTFYKKNTLNIRYGFLLAIPVTVGSVIGAQTAVTINKDVFENIAASVMLIMLFFIVLKPEKWIKEQSDKVLQMPKIWHYLVYLVIGFYGGFIHIGVGIFLLAALVLLSGFNLLYANALKIFIVFIYSPFVLAVFMLNKQVDYSVGFIVSIGNLLGGIIASYYAVKKGANFIRWILILVLLIFSAQLFGFFELFL